MSSEERALILSRIESSKDYSEAQKTVLRKVYSLTPAQGFATLVTSGIYTSRGKLTDEYKLQLFIEKRDSEYVILRGGRTRPIKTAPTQERAIELARKLKPEAAIHVERVRDTEGGKPDKWRKV